MHDTIRVLAAEIDETQINKTKGCALKRGFFASGMASLVRDLLFPRPIGRPAWLVMGEVATRSDWLFHGQRGVPELDGQVPEPVFFDWEKKQRAKTFSNLPLIC